MQTSVAQRQCRRRRDGERDRSRLEETATDPDLNAWYDRRGYENADKCAWTFGTTYTVATAPRPTWLGRWLPHPTQLGQRLRRLLRPLESDGAALDAAGRRTRTASMHPELTAHRPRNGNRACNKDE